MDGEAQGIGHMGTTANRNKQDPNAELKQRHLDMWAGR